MEKLQNVLTSLITKLTRQNSILWVTNRPLASIWFLFLVTFYNKIVRLLY